MKFLTKLHSHYFEEKDFLNEKVLTHKISEELKTLSAFLTTKDLVASSVFQNLKTQLHDLIFGYEYGCYADEFNGSSKPFVRAVLWHLENGLNYPGILDALRNRALIRKADIYFLPAVDIGMARSGNHNVVRDLAIELGYNYFFSTSYLNLNPDQDGQQNSLGLEGNAIMSRFPISNLRYIPLDDFYDYFNQDSKKLGCEKVLLVDLLLDNGKKITVVCINMPRQTSAGLRYFYVKQIYHTLKREAKQVPVLFAGDFKTSTYNCRTPAAFLLSLINKKYRDYNYIIQEHHTHPEFYFEKKLFHYLKAHGFEYTLLNEMGVGTCHVAPIDLMSFPSGSQKIENLCRKLLQDYQERLDFKFDWFSANNFIRPSLSHQAERPKIITHLFSGGHPVSNHDPVLLDFEVVEAQAV